MKRLLDENSFCVALWPVSRAFHPGCWLNKMHQHFEFCNVATGWGCLLFMLAEGNKFVPTYIQTWKKTVPLVHCLIIGKHATFTP